MDREKMKSLKREAIGRGPVQVEPRVSNTYRDTVVEQPCLASEQQQLTFQALDYNDMLLNELHDRVNRLRNRIDPILETLPECADNKSAGRIDNTILNSRVNTQSILLEHINEFVEDLIGRVRL